LQEIEIEMRLQPTAIDVLDDLARAAHDLVPSTMRVIGPKVVPIDVNPPSEPLPPVTDGPRAPMVAGDEHTILRPMPEASAPSPAPEREPTDAIEKTVLASSLTGGTARRESPEPARRKGLWLAVVGVLLLALLGGGTAFALRGGPAAEPSASEPPTSEPPTSEPPTSKPPAPPPPPVPVYAVKVEYPESRIPTKEYDNGLEWEVDVCWGRPKGLTRDQAKTHYSQSALYKRVDGKWKNTRSPVLLKEDGRCTGPGEVNQIVAATAATPDEATAGKGWSACQDYLLVVPASELGSVSTARTTQPICVRTSLTMEPQP
jgi:hypothetical protein